ncbi:MAG: UDP-glucose dehydrogenase family protein [Candidatus Omnitrophota bacterium]
MEETGLQDLLKRTRTNLKATQNYKEAILETQLSFIVVATPSLRDGSFSNEYLKKALHRIADVLKIKHSYHLVVITSTVMPQTTEKVAKFILERDSSKKCGKDFGICYNPEFIALGSVIHDFLNPDFVLIGEMNKKDGDILETIYKKTCENNPRCARMSPVNAEITKIALNCYITTKITFANSVASICEKVKGADAGVILEALGLDSRIGSKYIRPGLGYGGPCFPRDNVAFSVFAKNLGMRAKLAEIVDEVNKEQIRRVVKRIEEILSDKKKTKSQMHIGILGLSYKPNSPVIEDSQALNITQLLVNEEYNLKVYDPQAMDNVRHILGDKVKYAKDKYDCLKDVDLGVILVPWKEFKDLNFKKLNKKILILDCWRILKTNERKIIYLGKGY